MLILHSCLFCFFLSLLSPSRHSVPVFLDMGGEDSPISSELLSFITFLTANETELARISGQSTASDDEVKKAAGAVQKKFGVKNILITLGERGSILFLENGSIESQQATKVEADKIVDTTGAGDCFRGETKSCTKSILSL